MGLRFMCFVACLVAALKSASWGSGVEPQSLFPDFAMWLWFVIAFFYAVAGFTVLIRGTD